MYPINANNIFNTRSILFFHIYFNKRLFGPATSYLHIRLPSLQVAILFQASTIEEPPDDNLYLGIVLTAVVVITGTKTADFTAFLSNMG